MSNKNSNFLKLMTGLVIGAAAGYVAGNLLAPKKGEELREDLKDFSLNVKNSVSDYAKDIKDKGEKLMHKSKDCLHTLKRDTDKNIINFLEEGKNNIQQPVDKIVEKVKRTSVKAEHGLDDLSRELKGNIERDNVSANKNSLVDKIKGISMEDL